MDLSSVSEWGTIEKQPLTPAQLFARAVSKNRGVRDLTLLYHTLPSLKTLGNTENAAEYLSLQKGENSLRFGEEVSTYVEACHMFVTNLRRADPEQAAESPLKETLEMLEELQDEATARQIYTQVVGALEIFEPAKYEETHYWHNEEPEPEDTLVRYTDVCVSGSPTTLEVECIEELKIPAPLFAAPESATPTLLYALQVMPYLTHQGVKAYRGLVSDTVDIYAPSVTPRRPDPQRGSGQDGIRWYERMLANFTYHGLIFLAPYTATSETNAWTIAVNTALLEHFFRFGPCNPAPVVHRLLEPLTWPLPAPPAYIAGFGLKGDRLSLSPYIKSLDAWRKAGLCDARARLPSSECLKVIQDPRFRFTNADTFLRGQGPLYLEYTFKEEVRTWPISTHIRIDPSKSAFEDVVTFREDVVLATPSVTTEVAPSSEKSFVLPPLRNEPAGVKETPEGIKPIKRVTDSDEWGIPLKEDAPGHFLAAGQTLYSWGTWPGYSEKVVVAPIWNELHKAYRRGELTEEQLRTTYSICWCAANEVRQHPAVEAINPSLLHMLRETSVDKNWWSYPTGKVRVHPYFMVNEHGQIPLSAGEAQKHATKIAKKESARTYYETAILPQQEGQARSTSTTRGAPPYRGPPRARGRRGGNGPNPNPARGTAAPSRGGGRSLVLHPAQEQASSVAGPSGIQTIPDDPTPPRASLF